MGEKDYQQVYLIKKFIKNRYRIKIILGKTIRFNNSLAYSSRNKLLNKKQIIVACNIAKKLMKYHSLIKKNFNSSKKLSILKDILKYKIKLEYIEIRNKINLSKRFNKNNFNLYSLLFK